MNFVCKRFGSVKLFTYICKRILKNKFRKLNLHERRKTHRDFVPTNRYFAKLNIYQDTRRL